MLKSKHKNAAIYIIKPFSPISKQGEMHILNRSAAFDKIADEFKNDKTVRYIDTDEWSGEITFLSGSIFPDRNGHEIIAGKLTEYLQTN